MIPVIIIPLTFAAAYTYRIRTEEKMLIEIFGNQYKEYQKASRLLIPFIL